MFQPPNNQICNISFVVSFTFRLRLCVTYRVTYLEYSNICDICLRHGHNVGLPLRAINAQRTTYMTSTYDGLSMREGHEITPTTKFAISDETTTVFERGVSMDEL